MGSDRIIVNNTTPIYLANRCSGCRFPVITVVRIRAEAQKSYTFSQSNAQHIARGTLSKATQDEIQYIKSCLENNSVLKPRDKSTMVAPGHFYSATFFGHNSPCPMCGAYEPWKSEAVAHTTTNSTPPIVFTEKYKAEDWANAEVLKIIDFLSAPSDEERRESEARVFDMLVEIKQLQYKRNNLPEILQLRTLREEQADVAGKYTKVGILDFKKKRYYSKQLSDVSSRLLATGDSLAKKQNDIDCQIIKLRTDMIWETAMAYECTGQVLSVSPINVYTYYMETREIPEEVVRSAEERGIMYAQLEEFLEIKMAVNGADESVQETPEENHPTDIDTTEAIFCRKCGFKLLPGSEFCSKCGSKIDS